ncbi:MAG: PAS domain S-box protein [Bacteroidales bacterium]
MKLKNLLLEAFKPLVFKRALRVALIVGFILNIINQWGSIMNGFEDFHTVQFFLTFLVPYLVSSYSSALAKFNFVSGEVAGVDARITCSGCGKSVIKVLKGDMVPYCHKCETKTRWKMVEHLPPVSVVEDDRMKSNALFAEFNPAPVLRVDAQGHILRANPNARMLFGIEGNGEHLVDIIPEVIDLNFRKFIETNSIKTYQIKVNTDYYQIDLKAVSDLGVFHIYASKNTAMIEERNQRIIFQTAIEKTSDSVMVTDVAGRITYVNPAFEEHSGFSFSEVKGKNPKLLKSGKQSPEFYAEMWQTIGKGQIWKGIFENKKKNGERYHEKATITPITGDDGSIWHFMAIKEDVTEELKMKDMLNSMALFARHNPAPVLRFCAEGEVKEANPAANKIFEVDSLIENSLYDFLPDFKGVDIEKLIKNNDETAITAKVKNRFFQFVIKGVSELDLCHVYGSDVTQQKLAEERINSMALFARFNPAPVLRFDFNGEIVEANPAAKALFKTDMLTGKSIENYINDFRDIDIKQLIDNDIEQLLTHSVDGKHFQLSVKGVSEIGLCHLYGADVTAQKEAETLIESMALFAKLNPEPVFRFGADFKVVEANPAAKETFPKMLKGEDIREVIPPFDELPVDKFINSNAKELREDKVNDHIYRFMLRGLADTQVCQVYTSDITERVEQEEKIREQAEKIQSSIQYAYSIQTAVLPSIEDINQALPENFLLYEPRDVVSGDFYWLKKVNDQIVIVIADSTGHGVPGAFMSMLGVAFLNEIVTSDNLYADMILNKLRSHVITTLSSSTGSRADGMDLALCIINPATRTIQYAGANNPFVLINADGINEVKPDRMPIGKYTRRDSNPFTRHIVEYAPGDVVYLFSDGYHDQLGGPNLLKFGSRKFKNMLVELHTKPFAEQKQILMDKIGEWRGDYNQIDDMLVMGFKL